MEGIVLYLVIFFVKIFEVSLATLRIVLITKGEKVKGAVIGFFEVIIWVLLAATVLINVSDDPIKVIAYAAGFALGNYTGSCLESYLALGTTNIQAIVNKEHGKNLSIALRESGLALTAVDAFGMIAKKEILYIHVPRKRVSKTVKLIKTFQSDVVITINDIKPVYGGYNKLRK